MKNKLIITSFIIIAILMVLTPSIVFATMDTNITIGSSGAQNSSLGVTRRILGIVQTIGSIISVVALIIIGIRYMCSSVEDKASMKGVLIYYVIGAVLVFATSNILGIAYDVINGLNFDGTSQNPTGEQTGGSDGGQTQVPIIPPGDDVVQGQR